MRINPDIILPVDLDNLVRGNSFIKSFAKGKTFEEVYNTCNTGSWLMYMYGRTEYPDTRKAVLIAAKCILEIKDKLDHQESITALIHILSFGLRTMDNLPAYIEFQNYDSCVEYLIIAIKYFDRDNSQVINSIIDAMANANLYHDDADDRKIARQGQADIFRENIKLEDFQG